MTIATLHDAVPMFGFAALLLAGALLLSFGSWWVLRRSGWGTWRIVGALGLIVASVPAWGYGLLFALIGWASVGCSPDAYECPF
jgi:hypothetical protein